MVLQIRWINEIFWVGRHAKIEDNWDKEGEKKGYNILFACDLIKNILAIADSSIHSQTGQIA